MVLIVAKCIVNSVSKSYYIKVLCVLIVAKCIVNGKFGTEKRYVGLY